MEYFVNERCIGCGLCPSICPEVFSMTEAGIAKAAEGQVAAGNEEEAARAMESCPVEAIERK